jgi:hypothetical protein
MNGRWINVVLGVALAASAAVASRTVEVVNNLLVGMAIFLVSVVAMSGGAAARRVNRLLGAWAIASPFVLGYEERLGLFVIGLGTVVIAASFWRVSEVGVHGQRAA